MTWWGNAARTVGQRLDAWVNPFTGFGTSRDKTAASYFSSVVRLTDPELSAMYHGDSIAGRMVDLIPREKLRQGVTWAGPDEATFRAKFTALHVLRHVLAADVWARCFGGSLLVLGVDDGQDATAPLDETRIQSFSFLKVYDRRRVSVERRVTTERDLFYGQPEVYRINRLDGGMAYVHRSRVIRFGGAMTGEEESRGLDGWDYSVLQKPYAVLQKFAGAYDSAANLLADASQGVFTMRGLISAIAQGGATGQKDLMTRATLLDMGRSSARAIMLDADGEKFERVATAFSGVPETLDRFANLLSAASEIPVTILMGQAPAGLNATGASDVRSFYDRIKTAQEQDTRAVLEKIASLIALAERIQAPVLGFPSLWQETPGERAERRLKVAQRDILYVENSVASPEEVALSRFKGTQRDPDDIAIDRDLRLVPKLAPKPAPAAPPPALPGTPPAAPPALPQPGAPPPPKAP